MVKTGDLTQLSSYSSLLLACLPYHPTSSPVPNTAIKSFDRVLVLLEAQCKEN